MDWKDLADRLADGAKVYKAFQEGEKSASMLAGFERAQVELSAQYDSLVAQVEQAKASIQAAQDEAARIRAKANQDVARQWSDFDSAYAKRKAIAQDDFDGWSNKITVQASLYAAEAKTWKDQIESLTSQASQLDAQIQSLIRVRDSLKAQLQSVV